MCDSIQKKGLASTHYIIHFGSFELIFFYDNQLFKIFWLRIQYLSHHLLYETQNTPHAEDRISMLITTFFMRGVFRREWDLRWTEYGTICENLRRKWQIDFCLYVLSWIPSVILLWGSFSRSVTRGSESQFCRETNKFPTMWQRGKPQVTWPWRFTMTSPLPEIL